MNLNIFYVLWHFCKNKYVSERSNTPVQKIKHSHSCPSTCSRELTFILYHTSSFLQDSVLLTTSACSSRSVQLCSAGSAPSSDHDLSQEQCVPLLHSLKNTQKHAERQTGEPFMHTHAHICFVHEYTKQQSNLHVYSSHNTELLENNTTLKIVNLTIKYVDINSSTF